ncbi:MAG: 3-hydroxybutyryl-CoA dehydrogenase [Francisellaceae bacterium]|nr:3-hydroxybutyryl-CoA dehydrogenase [Francisellaceae bacterium]
MKTIGIIGSGVMGQGIAKLCLENNLNVKLFVNNTPLPMKTLNRMCKYNVQESNKFEILTTYDNIPKLDYIIEAVTEDYQIKKEVLFKIEHYIPKNIPIFTNTSSLSINSLSLILKYPERFMGIHFMNPPFLINFVELIRGEATNNATQLMALDLLNLLKLEYLQVNDQPTFLINRLLIPMINQAIGLLEKGYLSIEEIDKGMEKGAKHNIGPFRLADLIGLDVCLQILRNLYNETQDNSFKPATLLEEYVKNKKLGKKCGLGFYKY